MDTQLALSSVQAAALANDDTVDLEALLQMPDDVLNTDNKLVYTFRQMQMRLKISSLEKFLSLEKV